jgi:hypothetical protein
MISMCWKHPNVYTAGDAYAPKHWPQQYVHYANTYGRDKVLFGTDWPVIDPERAVREVTELGLRREAHRALMRDNALRLFKLPGLRNERRSAEAGCPMQRGDEGTCHEGGQEMTSLHRHLRIADGMRAVALREPGRPALECDGRALTCGEFARACRAGIGCGARHRLARRRSCRAARAELPRIPRAHVRPERCGADRRDAECAQRRSGGCGGLRRLRCRGC